MLKELTNPLAAYQEVYNSNFNLVTAKRRLPINPLFDNISGKRPNSMSAEDPQFGDVGKGNVVITFIEYMKDQFPKKTVYTYRWNGSRNAGHAFMRDGVKISLHQLPVGCAIDDTVNFLGKGMLIHAVDLVNEMDYLKSKKNGTIPGKIVIDGNASIGTDLHSAYESFMMQKLGVGRGSTGSGVSQGYAEWYLRTAIPMWTFKEKNWEALFRAQYRYYTDIMGGENVLASMEVNGLKKDGTRERHQVGIEAEFMDRLREARRVLMPLIDENVSVQVYDIWRNTDNPFIFEGAQGGGIDAHIGVYPDITASRPLGVVGIADSTEHLIKYSEISFPALVIKIPYMTIVGSKIPPYKESVHAARYRNENDERGETTKRDRSVYPEDFVLMQRLVYASEGEYLIMTHADAAHEDIPLEAVIGYEDIFTREQVTYRPYQWYWDRVNPVKIDLPSWNGQAAHNAKNPDELPNNLVLFQAFAQKALDLPVAAITNGKDRGDVVLFFGRNN